MPETKTEEQINAALTLVEMAIADAAERGVHPLDVCLALAHHLNRQTERLGGEPLALFRFKLDLIQEA